MGRVELLSKVEKCNSRGLLAAALLNCSIDFIKYMRGMGFVPFAMWDLYRKGRLSPMKEIHVSDRTDWLLGILHPRPKMLRKPC